MSSELTITCFTDLKNSTAVANKVGNTKFAELTSEHINLGKSLAKLTGGTYIKNIGDANFVRFAEPLSAIRFAVLLQEFCATHDIDNDKSLHVRVGIVSGVAEAIDNDLFGQAANLGARVQGTAEPDEVIIDESLAAQLRNIWGSDNSSKYLESKGNRKLKGFDKEVELFAVRWSLIRNENSDEHLGGLILQRLNEALIEVLNITSHDLASGGTVIWPIVPRNIVTAIHRGQIEIIRILTKIGWKVSVLFADCGAQKQHEMSYTKAFETQLQSYCRKRNINISSINYTSLMYAPGYSSYDRVQQLFRRIASDLTLDDLLLINNKGYRKDVQNGIRASKTLDCLRPALTTAAVLHLAQESNSKSIVIAGADEQIQWNRCMSINGTRPLIGCILNPILKIDKIHQEQQTQDWPIWNSTDDLLRQMKKSNLALWAYSLHAFLPAFPSNTVTIGDKEIEPPCNWNRKIGVPAKIDGRELVNHVWSLLDPGN